MRDRPKILSSFTSTFAVLLGVVAAVVPSVSAADRKQSDGTIRFSEDLDQSVARARAENTPLFLTFGAVWCPVCRVFEEETLIEPQIRAVSDDFIWVRIDIDRRASLAQEWGIEAAPTIFLLDPSGRPHHRIVGGVSGDRLRAILEDFLAGPDLEGAREPAMATTTFNSTPLTSGPEGFRGHSICFSHVGYGPLSVRSQSPFQSLRLGILPRTPSTLTKGQHQLRLGATWSNIWANDDEAFNPEAGEFGRYLLDYESLDLSLSYAFGMTDTLELDVEYEHRRLFGGGMDGFIQGFHDFFGIDQSGRDLVDRDLFTIFIDPGEGRPVVEMNRKDRGTFSRSLLVSLQHNMTCGSKHLPALSWAVTGRWSIGENMLEGGGFDVAASVAAARRFGSFYTYVTLGLAHFGSHSVYGLELEETQFTILAALEWRFNPRMSFILQYLGSEGVATDLPPFSKPSNEIVIGWKGEIGPDGVLEVGLLENVLSFDNSPDFGIHAAYSRRF